MRVVIIPQKDPEKYREYQRIYQREYYHKNKDKINKKRRFENINPQTRENRLKYTREYNQRPEVKEKRAIRQYAKDQFKETLLKECDYKCPKCGSKKNLELHHDSYKVKDGCTVAHNIKQIRVLCRNCHRNVS